MRDEIIDRIVQFMSAFDTKDWTLMRALLAEEVFCDYASFRGTPPGVVRADAYVAERRRSLSHLRLQHNVTNFLVVESGDGARCRCNYQIYRFATPEADGEVAYFHSFGRYHFGLGRGGDGWRIRSIRQEMVASWGEADLHPGAGGPRVMGPS
jgi:hypothetical protein